MSVNTTSSQNARPVVSIIMGSDSDLPTMSEAAKILEKFNVPYEITLVSAHRTPERLQAFAKTAESRGIQVIIAGAGGAAHLPGMTAANTIVPVIGVPVVPATAASLNGVDALHSIVQMPKGIPVATVAIGNATNAALLALRILATHDLKLKQLLHTYAQDMAQEVINKATKLESVGWQNYTKPTFTPLSDANKVQQSTDMKQPEYEPVKFSR